MRITNNMATQLAVMQFDVARQKLEEAQRKVTTGKAFERASEDPTGAATVMANTGALRALEQYKRNIGVGNRRLSLEENAVDQLTSLITRAKELAISQATDTASSQTRQVMLAEVNQLVQQAVNLANTQIGSDYLFGGTTSATAPFTIDTSGPAYTFTASGSAGGLQLEIGNGQRATATHDGTELFGTETAGVLKSLADFAAALSTGQQAAVASSIAGLDDSLASSQTRLGEVGARQNQMQIADANIAAFKQNLIALNSDLQDVDLENAITELVGRQTAYQAAMAATSRVMSLNLTDYLR
ncbi:MAG: flagellar hook-associated protein FlgL [Gemmatimonadota bacterium]|nr:flagellar hook-associated protein FlgL [Gemmatimonadota bacterium]